MQHFRNQRFTAPDSGALALIASGPVSLASFQIHAAAARWVQLFDAAATGDVTLGTTPPTLSIFVAANTQLHWQFNRRDTGLYFPRGLCYAITTTVNGSTTGAATSTFWWERE